MKKIKGIYVIIDPDFINSENPIDMTKKVLDGGAKIIQLRNKNYSVNKTIEWGKQIVKLCNEYDAISIINDRVDIALIAEADGVHLGQKDIYPNLVKNITSKKLIIGSSNALISEVEESERNDTGYIAIGSIFPTSTKNDTRPASLQLLIDAKKLSQKPIVAIGGINQQNIESTVETGVDSICIATAITLAKDPEKTTKSLSKYFNNY
ncbi:MAG: thiamine phosphate synthase [Dehalococcoidales bacterium]|jgi:thiamine-phosphate diphosphorylase|nr:thiamine phosphate synthase [Dehalococcoidales bacterium]|tara:strand:+ start:1800 stop:2423 length:624 start_codon:yes stop_codon:yes gene_type:complete